MALRSYLSTLAQSPPLLPLYEALLPLLKTFRWRAHDYLGPRPQFIKKRVLAEFGIPKAPWIETGTYLGTTTAYLARRAPHVYSFEPAAMLFAKAQKRFENANVTLINAPSEDALPELLATLSGDINFWLDGHYSAGATYEGAQFSPILDELAAIEATIPRFDKIAILVDDARLFAEEKDGYPSLDILVDFARKHDFAWCIENDIFIIRTHATSP